MGRTRRTTRTRHPERIDTSDSGPPLTSSPFAGLEGLRDQLPLPDEHLANPFEGSEPLEAGPPTPTSPQRARVRLQRRGRAGKEVTLVEGLDLDAASLKHWLQALRKDLGCGGSVEGKTLVLQGDQRRRLPDRLRCLGVARVADS